MVCDRPSERAALLAVSQGELECPLTDPHPARRDVDAAGLKRIHHLPEALAEPRIRATEDALRGAAVTVEHNLARLDPSVAHLVDLRRDRHPLEAAGIDSLSRLLLSDEAG